MLKRKKLDVAKILIAQGSELGNEIHTDHSLSICCREGFLEETQLLLQRNFDPNLINDKQETPIFILCKNETQNQLKIGAVLVDSGALLNCRDQLGKTPLLECVLRNKLGLIELFLNKNGSIINDIDSSNQNGLHLGVQVESPETLQLLLKYGINTDL